MFRNISKLLMTMVAISLIASACTEDGKGKTTGDDFNKSIVTDCTKLENKEKPECVQQCIEKPELEWCKANVTAKFTCPTDGTFKAVNPFTGKDVNFETPSTIQDVSGELMLATKSFEDGEFETLLAGRGNSLFIDQVSGSPSIDLGATVTNIDTFTSSGKFYAIAGTADNLKVVPFTKGASNESPTIDTEGVKTFDKVGGIKQVISATSVDLSGASSTKSLPPGMTASVNVPVSGTLAESSGGSIDFVYMVSAAGDVWRVKFEHLINGGCVEMLYAASDNLDGKNHKMAAGKIGVAGQYLAVMVATAFSELPNLDDVKADWDNYESNLIDTNQAHKLITNEFYSLTHFLAKPEESKQRIKTIDLLSSKDGSFKEVNINVGPGSSWNYFPTDILLKGTELYIAAYTFDLNDDFVDVPEDNNLQVFAGMLDIWDKARSGAELTDLALINFNAKAGASILKATLTDLTKKLEYERLPRTTGESSDIPTSIFTRIASNDGTIYIRGENRYFASLSTANFSLISPEKIVGGNTLTPWSSTFDKPADEDITSFISGLEKLNVSDSTATLVP